MRYSHLLGSTALSRINKVPPPLSDAHPEHTQISLQAESVEFQMTSQERGVIISNPLRIEGTSVHIESSEIDPSELRRSLLFWDKIIWPETNGIHIDGGVDIDYLKELGKLIRPRFHVNGDAATALSMAFSESYSFLEGRHPGQWLLSRGEKSLQVHGKQVEEGRGVVAHLFNAVPVPVRTMPLEDVIAFKEKRGDEVIALRTAIDDFYQKWINSEDKDHQLKLAITRIDTASADMVRVAREIEFPFVMSSWKVNFNLSFDATKAVMGYLTASAALELGTVSSLLAGAASSTLSIGTDIGIKKSEDRSPFNYVASMERSLF